MSLSVRTICAHCSYYGTSYSALCSKRALTQSPALCLIRRTTVDAKSLSRLSHCRRLHSDAFSEPTSLPADRAVASPSSDHNSRSGTESHLQLISESEILHGPTAEDFLRLRPPGIPPATSAAYRRVYDERLEHLSKSFTKQQLASFESMHIPGLTKSRTKRKIVENIMDRLWNLPSISKLEAEKREQTELHFETIEVAPSELFLLLGPDGSDLVELSNEHAVQISVSPDPLALTISGTKSSAQKFRRALRQRNEKIDVTYARRPQIDTAKLAGLLQTTSRHSGAFLELKAGQIQISARDRASAKRAESLMWQIALQDLVSGISKSYILTASPSSAQSLGAPLFPTMFALYPTHIREPLSQMAEGSSYFRISRVNEWLLSPDLGYHPFVRSSVVRKDGLHRSINEIFPQTVADYKDEGVTVLIASFGHFLHSFSKHETKSSVEPLTGSMTFSHLGDWLGMQEGNPIFVPLSPTGISSKFPNLRANIRRATYLSVSKQVPSDVRMFCIDATGDIHSGLRHQEGSKPSVLNSGCLHSFCGQLHTSNLLIPTRPYDIQLSLWEAINVPQPNLPPALSGALRLLRCGHDQLTSSLPLEFEFQGRSYHLQSDTIVAQRQDMPGQLHNSESGVTAQLEVTSDHSFGHQSLSYRIRSPNDTVNHWEMLMDKCDALNRCSS